MSKKTENEKACWQTKTRNENYMLYSKVVTENCNAHIDLFLNKTLQIKCDTDLSFQ